MHKKHLLFCNDQLLLEENEGVFSLPSNFTSQNACFIGNYNGYDCYVTVMTSWDINLCLTPLALRLAFQKCDQVWHNVISRAYQITRWDCNHQFCGKCGNKTVKIDCKFERYCDDCQLSFFPRLSPAIIVLIKKGNQILMARQKSFPEGVFSLIAGFVEAGESLEEAVHREVYEEVGIHVKNISYYGSQSWPFPDSLMIGFIADYEAGEIHYRDGEIESAMWCDVNHLPGLPSSSHSIAMTMIKDFMNDLLV